MIDTHRYFGFIKITGIENIVPDNLVDNKMLMEKRHTRFVHYTDSQQLIIWLPKSYLLYDHLCILETGSGQSIYFQKIGDMINGSVQVLLDTIFIYPGQFQISITRKDGLEHHIYFIKYLEGIKPIDTRTPSMEHQTSDPPSRSYKDGKGHILTDEDLILRDGFIKKSVQKFLIRLEYATYGRSGEVFYIDGPKRIKFDMEIGAEPCVFYIRIPSASSWEVTTGYPLSARNDIIMFVAKGTQREQAPSCVFTISDEEITYYKNS